MPRASHPCVGADFGTRVRLDYLQGLTRIDDGFTVLLSVDRFLTASDLLEAIMPDPFMGIGKARSRSENLTEGA